LRRLCTRHGALFYGFFGFAFRAAIEVQVSCGSGRRGSGCGWVCRALSVDSRGAGRSFPLTVVEVAFEAVVRCVEVVRQVEEGRRCGHQKVTRH
jgi:hypothetical protein